MLDSILSAFDGHLVSLWGPFALLVLCGFGLPMPEDIVLVAAGFLSADYGHSLGWTIALMYLGIIIGDFLIFTMGRLFGQKVLGSRVGRFLVNPEKLPKIESMFMKYGAGVIFVGRFLPGLRAPVYLTAGTLRFPIAKFLLLDGVAALISAPLFVWLGSFAWEKYSEDLDELKRTMGVTKMVFIAAALVLAVILFSVFRLRAKKEKTV